MALITQRPKGTQDILPCDINMWRTVEHITADTAECYGYKEIRFPVFEHTELFKRSVGDTTDVVQKEMYTFTDKGERSITLRPEGTAGAVRAMLENGLLNDALPQRVYYNIPCFRYEKPQAGRFRQFHQFGVEMFGADSHHADADIIALADDILKRLGLKNIELFINSMGCPQCRAEYNVALKEYFEEKKSELCNTCSERLERNPARILDCKSPVCGELSKNAPVIIDFLCGECSEHFDKLKLSLDNMGIAYEINPKIVRGLDYYTKTVFEFVSSDIGAQGTVCGGGRYDGLIELLGGKHTPALGFAMGIERLILTMQNQNAEFMPPKVCDIYIAIADVSAYEKAAVIVKQLRNDGFYAEYDMMNRGLKAQMKYADKIKAAFTVVIGGDELASGSAKLKNMLTGELTDIALDDKFSGYFSECMVSHMFEGKLV